MEAKVGESPTLHFTVTSEPPLAEDIRHTLTHEDGRTATKRFKIEKDKIIFCNVRVADTGIYAISCRNAAGLVGKETLELEVTPGMTCESHLALRGKLSFDLVL